jgi:hypothetical protein
MRFSPLPLFVPSLRLRGEAHGPGPHGPNSPGFRQLLDGPLVHLPRPTTGAHNWKIVQLTDSTLAGRR